MRWLKRRSRPVPAATAGQREADKALEKAEQRLEETTGETRAILDAADKLRRLGETNDFAARIREAMGGT